MNLQRRERHIKNIFKEGELDQDSVYAKFAYTATDGKIYQVAFYSYYYGIVTMGSVRRGHIWFRVPNECVRRQIFEYMRSSPSRAT